MLALTPAASTRTLLQTMAADAEDRRRHQRHRHTTVTGLGTAVTDVARPPPSKNVTLGFKRAW
jgi:hypothetical protein